jgi:hypothetical protein
LSINYVSISHEPASIIYICSTSESNHLSHWLMLKEQYTKKKLSFLTRYIYKIIPSQVRRANNDRRESIICFCSDTKRMEKSIYSPKNFQPDKPPLITEILSCLVSFVLFKLLVNFFFIYTVPSPSPPSPECCLITHFMHEKRSINLRKKDKKNIYRRNVLFIYYSVDCFEAKAKIKIIYDVFPVEHVPDPCDIFSEIKKLIQY